MKKKTKKSLPLSLSLSPSFPPPPLFSEGKVKMPLEKKEALEKEFGKERVAEVIEDLKEYAEINPKKFKDYACHATVIRSWIRKDAKTGKPSFGNSLERNREWARVVATKYADKQIEAGPEALGFLAGNYPFYIKYTELGFQNQVIGRLKKMNLITEGLM